MQYFSGGRVFERKKPGMERLPVESLDDALQWFREFVRLRFVGAAIFQITYKRMTNMSHMNTDLMCSASFQPAFDERGKGGSIFFCTEPLLNLEMSNGMACVVALFMHYGLLGAIAMGASKRGIDRSGFTVGRSPDDGKICPLQITRAPVISKLGAQMAVGKVVFGHDHNAAGFFVQAMHNARPLNAANARQSVAAVMDQRIDQRAGPIAVARVHHQPGRFVDNDEISVFVQNVERYFFALGCRILRLRDRDCDAGTLAKLVLGLTDGFAVNAYLSLTDKRLNAISRQIWCQLSRKPRVQPFAGCLDIGN